MDALEFAREYKRMCNYYEAGCGDCPACEKKTICYEIASTEVLLPIVEKWSKEHPIVRNVDHIAEELKRLGYDVDKEYLMTTCPVPYSSQFTQGHTNCPKDRHCEKCRKWWEEEYKDKGEE